MRSCLVILASAILAEAALAGPTLEDSIDTVRRAPPNGEGSAAAANAWRQLAAAGPADLPVLLAGMDGASPLARNWLRSAIDRILEQAAASKLPLPTASLDTFLRDLKHDPQVAGWPTSCSAKPT